LTAPGVQFAAHHFLFNAILDDGTFLHSRTIRAPAWFDVDRYVGAANLFGNCCFKMIGEVVRRLHAEIFADGEMKIHELLRPGATGAEIVNVEELAVVLIDEAEDFVADLVGEFGVEHVAQGMAGEAEGFLEDVEGNEE